jgi:hypothetical protein
MLSKQEEMLERKRTFENDRRLREQQGTTMQACAQADAEIPGRFAAVAQAFVIGSKPDVASAYPAASSAHQVELPNEPPLGFDNPALESSSFAQEPTGPTSASVGPFSQLSDPAVVSISQPSRHVHPEREAGSSPLRRRRL